MKINKTHFLMCLFRISDESVVNIQSKQAETVH